MMLVKKMSDSLDITKDDEKVFKSASHAYNQQNKRSGTATKNVGAPVFGGVIFLSENKQRDGHCQAKLSPKIWKGANATDKPQRVLLRSGNTLASAAHNNHEKINNVMIACNKFPVQQTLDDKTTKAVYVKGSGEHIPGGQLMTSGDATCDFFEFTK